MKTLSKKDIIPRHFKDDEEAGEFWDNHSADDFWDEMEETDIEFDIRNRRFLIPINDRVYQLAKDQAKENNCTVEQLINNILDRNLSALK